MNLKAGLVYRDARIMVAAFPVRHAGLEHAFGFRVETPHKTAPTAVLTEHCRGCDVLIHEAYSEETYRRVATKWQAYRRSSHTSSVELAALANQVRPGLLVLPHRVNVGAPMSAADPEDTLLAEARRLYDGTVVTGHDLDVF
jgi:ribonuclease BN (tRNA processing enzyme)